MTGRTPVWEQELSAGAVCYNLLLAANASGWAGNWLSEWPAFDDDAGKLLGLEDGERVAGFIYLGTATVAPPERPRRPTWPKRSPAGKAEDEGAPPHTGRHGAEPSPSRTACAAQDGPRVFTEKDKIYDLIENCTPSRSRESVLSDPDSPLTVSCRNTCFEARLNSWLAESPDNRQRYFATKDIYDIERSARLFTCREGSAMVEKSSCVGQFAPDILAKVGPIPCGESVNCEVRFDIDDAGRPTQLSANLPARPGESGI
jgi:hypothetical protein